MMEWQRKMSIFAQVGQNSIYRPFLLKKNVPYMDVNIRSVDVKTRKPFGLRSNYVQITFNYVQITFNLRKNYVKIT